MTVNINFVSNNKEKQLPHKWQMHPSESHPLQLYKPKPVKQTDKYIW